MPIFNPLAALIVLPFAAAILWVLARLPAAPEKRSAFVLWALLLFTIAGSWTYAALHPNPMVFWTPTPLARTAQAVFLLLPFALSLFLWGRRRATPDRPSARVAVWIMILGTVVTLVGFSRFNKTCVYYDYHHDTGQAWCPTAFQAHL